MGLIVLVGAVAGRWSCDPARSFASCPRAMRAGRVDGSLRLRHEHAVPALAGRLGAELPTPLQVEADRAVVRILGRHPLEPRRRLVPGLRTIAGERARKAVGQPAEAAGAA